MAKRIVDEEMRFSIIVNGDKAQKELFELENRTRTLNAQNKDYRAEQAKLVKQGLQNTEAYKKLSAEIRKNNTEIKEAKVRMGALQKEIGVTGLTLAQLQKRASELRLTLRNLVPGSADYKRYQKDLQEVTGQMAKLKVQASTTTMSIGTIANGFNKYAALGASVIATGAGIVLSIQKVLDFNGKLSDSQADVMKTTGLTKKEVDELTKSFGAFSTRTTRIELLGLAEEAGRLGITGVKNLKDFVAVANEIKVALGDELSDEAIREVGKMANIYQVGQKEGKDFADSLTALGSAINEVSASGANQASFLVDYLKRQAGVASQTRISAQQNLGYAATFDEIGQSVEVSATAMNKVWFDLFENTDTYAKIAGVSLAEFTQLLNTDANEAMILFLEGLQGNNEGMAVMVEKLADIEVGGARGTQALSALAGNVDLLRQRQATANTALKEATSLTNEYNLKNNNLAATLGKIQKRIMGGLASPLVIGGLSALTNMFARLIGAVQDLNEEFEQESKNIFESAKANRQLANSSQELLEEYERLYKEGVKPTAEEKLVLDGITLQLQQRLGDSVVAIDKETGALELNTEAVRNQIKAKRLAADEEAATLASRLKGAQEEKERLEKLRPALQQQVDAASNVSREAQRKFAEANPGQFYDEETSQAVELSVKKRTELFKLNKEIEEQEKRRISLLEQLKELNFNEFDVDLLFNDTPLVGTGGDGGGTGGGSGRAAARAGTASTARQKALLDFQRETEDSRIAIIADSFQKELELQRVAHERKIANLEGQRRTQGEDMLAINAEINEQIELQNQLHELSKSEILARGLQAEVDKRMAALEQQARNLERQRDQDLITEEEYQTEMLGLQEAYKDDVIGLLNAISNEMGSFKGLDLSILSPDQVAQFEALGDRVIEKLNQIMAAKNGKGDQVTENAPAANPFVNAGLGGTDILGFSVEQWAQTFENLDTTAQKLDAMQMVLGATMEGWGMYYDFLDRKSQVEAQNFDRAQEKKRLSLQQSLDSGFINQRQYNEATRALEQEREKFNAEMDHKRAKRDKQIAIANIIQSTALGVMRAVAASPLTGGLPWSAIIGAMGALQLGLAVATPLPAKGFEDGFYGERPVRRSQDGKLFNAGYGGEPTSQLVKKPTMFLAGEGGANFPEMIIDGRAFRNFRPDFKDALYREIARAKGFESGYYPKEGQTANNDSLIAMLLKQNIALLQDLKDNPIQAYLPRTMQNAKHIKEDIEQYTRLRNKNKR